MDEKIAYMVTTGDKPCRFSTTVHDDLSEALREFRFESETHEGESVTLARVRYKLKPRAIRTFIAIFGLSFGISFPGGLDSLQVKAFDMKFLLRQEAETALPSRGYV
jgi:hypothetical protein